MVIRIIVFYLELVHGHRSYRALFAKPRDTGFIYIQLIMKYSKADLLLTSESNKVYDKCFIKKLKLSK